VPPTFNLIDDSSSNFDDGSVGRWTALNSDAAVANLSGQSVTGNSSMSITCVTDGSTLVAAELTGLSVMANAHYMLSCNFHPVNGSVAPAMPMAMWLRWFDLSSHFISEDYIEVPWNSGSTFQLLTLEADAPVGAVTVVVRLALGTGVTHVNQANCVDQIQLIGPAPVIGPMLPSTAQWRFMLANRYPHTALVSDLTDARSRSLHFDLLDSCTAQFTIDGRSPQLAPLLELTQDVVCYRTDPYGTTCMFRGPVGDTEDQLTDTSHTVNVTAADYRAMLGRRINGNTQWTITNTEQATIVAQMLAAAQEPPVGSGIAPVPPFDLGLKTPALYNPDGSHLATTSTARDRTYTGGEDFLTLIGDLGNCLGGFDWSVEPVDPAVDTTRSGVLSMWYPERGVAKPDWIAEYGSTIVSCTRTVRTSDFSNLVRYTGQLTGTGGASPPNVYAYVADAVNNPSAHPEGMWEVAASAPDVSESGTLQQQANGLLDTASLLQPSYTLNVARGAWTGPTDCWLGDTIECKVVSGRLQVDTTLRILAVDITVNDEGSETVAFTVGRPAVTLRSYFINAQRRLTNLERA
jgi:hypothetical protein